MKFVLPVECEKFCSQPRNKDHCYIEHQGLRKKDCLECLCLECNKYQCKPHDEIRKVT